MAVTSEGSRDSFRHDWARGKCGIRRGNGERQGEKLGVDWVEQRNNWVVRFRDFGM